LQQEDGRFWGYFSKEQEGKVLSFDGIVNAFPVGIYSQYTNIPMINLTGEMIGEIAIQIIHADDNGDESILYEESFSERNGLWKSPPMTVPKKKGRIYLSCRIRGQFSFRQFGWWTALDISLDSPVLICITTYKSNKFLDMLRNMFLYHPLGIFKISILVVDNGQTFSLRDLPNDPRISMISQPNLGACGGVMRGLWFAKKMGAHYLLTVADDDMILHPEIIYRTLILQMFAKDPLSIGAMMLNLDRPTVLHEQGAVIHNTKEFMPIHFYSHGSDLSLKQCLGPIYQDRHFDYNAWWLMSTPVSVLPFLPAFFIYKSDILQGLLLNEKGIRTIAPPHLFIWQTFGLDFQSYKGYDWFRNELPMRFCAGYPVHRISSILWFSCKIIKELANYDYFRAKMILQAFEDVLKPSKWASDPLLGAERTVEIRRLDPKVHDLTDQLSEKHSPVKWDKMARSVFLIKKFFFLITLAGYLNPFSKRYAPDGKIIFRFYGDNEAWKWRGYRRVAVVNTSMEGYICDRSWKNMLLIVYRTIMTSVLFLIFFTWLRKKYQTSSADNEKIWDKTFEIVDRNGFKQTG
jgi:galactofuranosylgalactofuranosylrhamnosyl-N-acetylglucosaminyl-diphospho-decaprenol beta-1,5/1,6-galactofuranosyltransferase